ncbi:hypothetical protein U5801_08790 [Lamprobacter modestohalophilus]|uniref:Uncharacterized protein n=1 Tax=Lamprobacter modestohalophilus TaxID=1064514 RepID=A0A9X0W936_9GAMM|nr:hypothetical protein [Lamprobacter modestohalophilus]MBK1619194.1 hypothetical protein [Lamprobacter modestohalophilus]MCF7976879.1 hypothetical protein [Chromatiaceae bacterium]MCF8017207.1 hypothetical protein [Chromatiaceae bacterium]MEA1049903.1 hypothetical protein [Lamprobacter modestohalophilus]
MKYTARRTWPEKSKSWEYLGESESLEEFALAFATDKALEVDTEFVVIEKAGAESEIEFFKVTRTSPYGLVTAAPRVESEGSSTDNATTKDEQSSNDGGDDNYGGVEAIAGAWRGVISNILMFVKAGGAAFLFFLAAIFLAKWLFNAW